MKKIFFKLIRIIGSILFGLFLMTTLILFFQKEYGAGVFSLLISLVLYYFVINKINVLLKNEIDQNSLNSIKTRNPKHSDQILETKKIQMIQDKETPITEPSSKDFFKLYNFENFQIPENVFELLWFGDGKYKNTKIDNEPSLIKKALIKKGLAEPIGYYPSYENLNPSQKFKYLNWLTDITKPIDVGYVFIFYYGLERHIVDGKREKAVHMIRALKKIINNASFQSYSNDALLLATMLDNNIYYLNGLNLDNNPLQTLAVKFVTECSCEAIDIINASNKIGFSNKRYINSHPKDFENVLKNLLRQQFGKEKYLFSIDEPNLLQSNSAIIANYSLSLDVRTFGFTDVLKDTKTQQELYNLLFITHEHVKEILKERRKITNKKVKENLNRTRIE